MAKERGSSGRLLLTGLLMDLSCWFFWFCVMSERLPLISGEEGAYLGWLLVLGRRSKCAGSGDLQIVLGWEEGYTAPCLHVVPPVLGFQARLPSYHLSEFSLHYFQVYSVSWEQRETSLWLLFRPEITVQLLIISNCVFFFSFPGEGPLYLRNWKKVSWEEWTEYRVKWGWRIGGPDHTKQYQLC